MRKEDLKKELWNIIGPIDVSQTIIDRCTETNSSEEYLIFLAKLSNPQTQKDAFFNGNNALLDFFATDYLHCILDFVTNVCNQKTNERTDEKKGYKTLHKYFTCLLARLRYPDSIVLQKYPLEDAEQDVLCYLIQFYLNNETKPIFKEYLSIVFLFPNQVINLQLLDSILKHYNLYNKKI